MRIWSPRGVCSNVKYSWIFAFVVYPAVPTDILQAFDQGAAYAAHDFTLYAFAFEAVFREQHEGIVDFRG